jgi:hypothetical protein
MPVVNVPAVTPFKLDKPSDAPALCEQNTDAIALLP